MKARLLKRLRKKVKKEYIIVSNYPEFEVHFKWADGYLRFRSYSKLMDAFATLQSLRNREIEYLVKKIKDEQRDKNLRKL